MKTHIPEEEILMDILFRLSGKSLFRFKCVSKTWKTLICDPYFKRKHLNHAKNQPNSQKLLFGGSFKSKTSFDFYCSFLSPTRLVKDSRRVDWPRISKPLNGFKIYCCCDALFLIGIWTTTDREEPSMLLLWNPTTSDSIILPHLESPQQISTYGLGYDSISDDYKVLRIDQEGVALDEILALKSGSWRKLDKASIICYKECLAFLHGAFHFLDYGFSTWDSMVSFNISDETYRRIPLPEENVCLVRVGSSRMKYKLDISVLGRMLCVFNSNETTFNLWIMKDYGVKESWTKLVAIPSNRALLILPIYRFSDGEVLLRYEEDGKPIYYRISDGLTNRIWPIDCDDIDPVTFDYDGFVYTESLISPRVDH